MAINNKFKVKHGLEVNTLTGTTQTLVFPTSDGVANQAIITDGAGNLTFGDARAENVQVGVKNVSGGTLTKGTPVHQTGTAGNNMEVVAARADTASLTPAVGILAQDLADQAEGYAIISGRMQGVNTSSFSEGDVVYLGPTGGYTTTKPTSVNHAIQNLGIVTKVHATNGGIVVLGAGRANDIPNFVAGDLLNLDPNNNGGKVIQANSAGTGFEFGGVTLGQSSRDNFTGDGSTNQFTLSQVYAGQNDILVFVDGVIQYPGANFTLNGTTLAFTSTPVNGARIECFGTSPLTQVNIPGDGTVTPAKLAASAYTRDIFTGNGSTATYNLTGDAGSPLAPFVFVGGVLQDPSTHYNIDVLVNPQTITFTSNLPNGTEATVVYGPVSSTGTPSDGTVTFQKLAPSVFNYDTFTGDGTTTTFTLSENVLEAKHLLVTVAAVMQTPTTAYTAQGTTLTFTSAPANGAAILVRYYVGASILTPADNSVSTVKIQDDAVTKAKLAFNPEDDAVALAIALG